MEIHNTLPGKILALDVGKKTIGCAIVGEDGIAPEPLKPILRKEGALSLGAIRRYLTTYRIHTLVIGLPLKAGRSSHQSRKTKGFIAKLKKHFPKMAMVVQDETLSTWSAKSSYSRLKLKKGTTPVNIDSFAALEILITYISQQKIKS